MKLRYVPKGINTKSSCVAIFERLTMREGEVLDREFLDVHMIFVTEGALLFSFNYGSQVEICSNHPAVLPIGHVVAEVKEDSTIYICNVNGAVLADDSSRGVELEGGSELYQLPFSEKIESFFASLSPNMDLGRDYPDYFELKLNELLWLMGICYSNEQLSRFFAQLSTPDTRFTDFVWNNYRKIKGVREFADLSTYGLSMFKEKFKKTFGVSVLRWLNEQKAKNIYYDLSYTDKTLKQICDEYYITSVSYLTTFCRVNLNATPTQIRKKRGNGII